ncbi:DNA/RNA non-specific endonuclease [Streptomyces sp. ITFR-6]|uniref:DNA/RNA non-specific endonuclease n=1 Tax=Streptomyces sp. ITFR-6 TaxID=3075197 RepID=UPI00288B0B2D|nr:DNA/RNA non-specific endonuclease [Streptomyces sp. ITFR-6]WNI34386.1 tectonin domain-containing protein [Streptomyces sp. ITFR-6]
MAGAIAAGFLSSFPALADEPAAMAPVALGSVTATGDDHLYGLAADHSAVYRWNGQGTDWTKVGGPAKDLYAGGAGLFATAPDTGKILKYDGAPDAWSQIGEPGADFAVTGDRLYALNPDRTAVYEWAGTGTDWTKVGGPANDLDAGGAGLFATGPDGKIFKYEGTPETWTQIGEPGAGFAVTGDRLYGIAADRTAVYEWAGHGTDWSRVGGPAQELYAGGAGLFATDPATGQLSKYDGKPDVWTKAGKPGAGFAVSDTHLYGLATNHTSVLQWTGTATDWAPLGAPTTPPAPPPAKETPPPARPQPQESTSAAPQPQEVVPAPASSDAPEPAEGPAAAEPEAPLQGESGQREITPARVQPTAPADTVNEHTVRMAVTAQDDLYTLAADNSAIWQRGSDGWTPISGSANAVYAGGAGVFMTGPDTEQVRKYNPTSASWDPIGGASGHFAVTGTRLYRLTSDGIGEWHGDTWTTIGGPAKNIYAGRAGLFATNPDTGDLYKYGGKPDRWTRIGGPGATFAVGGDHVYAINPDHTGVYEWTGKNTDWTKIGEAATDLYAGGSGLFATNPASGNISKYNGAPGQWTEIGGRGSTFAVSDTQLYGLSPDLATTYRWNGTSSDWTRIGGAADVAQQRQDEQLLAQNCETGRDCVKEYRDAKKLLETSLTDWLQDNEGQILLDTFGVTATLECVEDHDFSSCLEVAADAGTTLLGVGVFKKSYKITKSVKHVAKELPKFRDRAQQARSTYDRLNHIIENAHKAAEQATDRPDIHDSHSPDCRVQGMGWVAPGTRDAAHGNRATTMNACLDKAWIDTHPGTRTDPKRGKGIVPPGYNWARSYAGYLGGRVSDVNACHLLAAQLSGSGTDLANLATCGSDANSYVGKPTEPLPAIDSMHNFENTVRSLTNSKHVVRYTVTPKYRGERTAPYEFDMSYTAWDTDGHYTGSDSTTISNLIYTAGQGWKNLGTVIHSETGADVPLAGQP